MNAVNLYTATSRCIMQANSSSSEAVSEVSRLLQYLRQCLSCCVCTGVLTVPMGPIDSICRHNVCKACIGGKMRLRPACSWCKDYNQFVENTQLRVVVQCFKKLCQYLTTSSVARSLNDNTNNGGTNNLLMIIQEGTQIVDDYEHHKHAPPLPVFAAIVKQQNTNENRTNMPRRGQGRPPGSKKRSRGFAGAAPSYRHTEQATPTPPVSPTRTSQRVAEEHDYINKETADKEWKESLPNSLASDSSGCEEPRVKLVRSPESSIAGSPRHKDSSLVALDSSFSSSQDAVPQQQQPVASTSQTVPKKRGRKPKCKVGCRCGLATPTPGKLTCCGQRCPCYSSFKGCIPECRCRGCRNPRKVPVDILTTSQLKDSQIDEDNDSEIEIDV